MSAMGLDSVELVMAVEEEFGVDLPDDKLAEVRTVGDFHRCVVEALGASPPAHCLKQRLFFKLRRAMMENYGLEREQIRLDAVLGDLVPQNELAQGLKFFAEFTELKFPRFRAPHFIPLFDKHTGMLTVGSLLTAMVTLNAAEIEPEPGSHDEVWVRLVRVIEKQINVRVDEIMPDASIAYDLGVE